MTAKLHAHKKNRVWLFVMSVFHDDMNEIMIQLQERIKKKQLAMFNYNSKQALLEILIDGCQNF